METGRQRQHTVRLPSLAPLGRAARIKAMRDWFLGSYEDPAENTPHDSGEGGYQYIWGGPYDALEEIGGAFGQELVARPAQCPYRPQVLARASR